MLAARRVVSSSERGTHFDLYYQRDLQLMKRSKPQLRRLCAKVAFDLILIDGNEYTGWGEFERVRDECRPRYVALHDTGTLKTAKVEAYLETHTDDYRLLLRKGETDASPACDLVGCLPEALFAPNEEAAPPSSAAPSARAARRSRGASRGRAGRAAIILTTLSPVIVPMARPRMFEIHV